MMRLFSKIRSSRRKIWLLPILAAVFITATFLFGRNAQAMTWASTVITGIIGGLISALGLILVLVINVLVKVASYSQFINSPAVVNGWILVRDVCNMFFVVILLIIAFGTILRLENYNYKKWLPKLILMAVLINFSKMICGLLIDVAQVAMLTFVNAFKDIAGGNLIEMLGIKEIMTIDPETKDDNDWAIIGAYVLGFIYMIIAIIVIVTMLAVLVMRMVMIWIHIVLSPLAYLLDAFPGGQKYSSQWWSDFTKNLIVGPVLAFFIWLSFATLQSTSLIPVDSGSDSVANDTAQSLGKTAGDQPVAFTQASRPSMLLKFIIAIGMLIGGLKISQDIGGAAGGLASKGMGAINKGKMLAARAGARAGRGVLRTAKNWGGDIVDKASLKMGVDLNVGAAYKRYRQAVEKRRQSRKLELRGKVLDQAESGKTWFGRKAALLSTGDVAYNNFKEHNFLRGGGTWRYSREIEKLGIDQSKQERAKVMSFKEGHEKMDSLLEEKKGNDTQLADVNAEINKKQAEITKSKQNSDYAGTSQAQADQRELDSLLLRKDTINTRRGEVDKEINNLQQFMSSKESVESHSKAMELDREIAEKEKAAEEYEKKIDRRSLVGLTEARIASQAAVESEQGKAVAYINNPDELVRMVQEGIKTGISGLVAVAAKKLARTGNYNELNKALNLGTDLKGMHKLAEYFHKEGGMDVQTSRGLVAEIGELAKGVGHIEAFGTMKMDAGGSWQEASSVEHEAAVLAEKTKIQSQRFVRDINRLGVGVYADGKPHTAENWTLTKSTIKLYAAKDSAYADDMRKTGNPSQIYFIGSNPKNLELLEKNGAPLVAKAIRDLMKGKAEVQDYAAAIRSIDDIY